MMNGHAALGVTWGKMLIRKCWL